MPIVELIARFAPMPGRRRHCRWLHVCLRMHGLRIAECCSPYRGLWIDWRLVA